MPFPPPPVPSSFTIGNPNAGHVTFDSAGARFYGLDGTTIVLEFDNATGALTVTDGTITGGTVQTAASGKRVVLSGAGDELEIYDSAGTLVATLSGALGGANLQGPGGAGVFIAGSILSVGGGEFVAPNLHLPDGAALNALDRGTVGITGSGAIAHGLGVVPAAVIATVQTTLFRTVTVSSTPTNASFNVTVWNPATGLADTNPRTVNWIAIA